MKRIRIIGSPGSGKTTFAKKLAQATALPLIHLGYYYRDTTEQTRIGVVDLAGAVS